MRANRSTGRIGEPTAEIFDSDDGAPLSEEPILRTEGRAFVARLPAAMKNGMEPRRFRIVGDEIGI
jgi:hypothetical protein